MLLPDDVLRLIAQSKPLANPLFPESLVALACACRGHLVALADLLVLPRAARALCRKTGYPSHSFATHYVLNWDGLSLNDSDMRVLAEVARCCALPNFRDPYLWDNSITDAGIGHLAGALSSGGFPTLDSLILDGNPIGDEGLATLISALGRPGAPRLRRLGFCRTRITEVSAQTLVDGARAGALVAEYIFLDGWLATHELLRPFKKHSWTEGNKTLWRIDSRALPPA